MPTQKLTAEILTAAILNNKSSVSTLRLQNSGSSSPVAVPNQPLRRKFPKANSGR
jgi:hypothetical protein